MAMKRERSRSSERKTDDVLRAAPAFRNAGRTGNQAVQQDVNGSIYTGTVNQYNMCPIPPSLKVDDTEDKKSTRLKLEDFKDKHLTHTATFEELRNSLIFDGMGARLRNIRQPHVETCKWLLEHKKFQDWNNDGKIAEHAGFFWIKGKPGSGKSVAMKAVLESCRKRVPKGVVISYFFNNRAPGMMEKSSLGLYRSLAYQVLRALPRLEDPFARMFEFKKMGGKIEDWTTDELQEFLRFALKSVGTHDITILIDALDEGNETDIRQLVAFLEEFEPESFLSQMSLRICLSSRHYPEISVKRCLSLVMDDESGHQDDIDKFIQTKLKYSDGAETDNFRHKVCQKSAGVFLWVILVIPMLNEAFDHGDIDAMSQCLEQLPEELDRLFSEILAKSSKSIDKCLLLFQWVLFARRSLTPKELYYALQNHGFTSGRRPDTSSDETIRRYLLSHSRGLVEVTDTKPRSVQFIHDTVQQFLRNNGITQIATTMTGSVEGNSHNAIKACCFQYVERCSPLIPAARTETNEERQKQKREVASAFPLSGYAVDHMFSHADEAQSHGVSQENFLKMYRHDSLLFHRWVRLRNALQIFKVHRYAADVHLIYVLAEVGLEHLIQVLINDSIDVNTSGGRFGNALQAACVSGHESTVRLLIECGSDVNAKGGEFKNALFAAIHKKEESIMRLLVERGAKPADEALLERLFITIARGYLPGVSTLIGSGAPVNSRNARGEVPLYYAVLHKLPTATVRVLIEHGADINARGGEHGEHVLHAAIRIGSAEIARLLTDHGADVNVQNDHDDTPLHQAAAEGQTELAQLLIDRGADVNLRGQRGTPFQLAANHGHTDMLQLLLNHRADMEPQEGGLALNLALAQHKIELAKLLIKHGADVNVGAGEHGPPLLTAVQRDHDGPALLIVGDGTDVNAQMEEYGNALQAASIHGYTGIVRLLIEHGANVNALGGQYGTALHAASYRGYTRIVRLLIEHGANVNALGGRHSTALYVASQVGSVDIVRLLIKHGADIDAQGGEYGTALQAAKSYRSDAVVQLLRAHGARDT